ncbi:HU family DNA-binding protein [Methyloversatilis discipulorum]|uniref:HU family DNA-binding protein n=1 Tax=Methyloversatilis discipulorum TaxID=1119528 RepID=UPI00037AAA5E|nr:HU family DNA-binding protein [Methyloversatilis discipulorum]
MNQQELTRTVSEVSGHSKKDVDHILKTLGEVVTANVADEEITLPGIGKLKPKTRAARAGRNPATGEEVQIPEKVTVAFKPAKPLIDALNG